MQAHLGHAGRILTVTPEPIPVMLPTQVLSAFDEIALKLAGVQAHPGHAGQLLGPPLSESCQMMWAHWARSRAEILLETS